MQGVVWRGKKNVGGGEKHKGLQKPGLIELDSLVKSGEETHIGS